MDKILIDLTKTDGKIKPMNAVNNGPTAPDIRCSYTSFDAYKAANIPYARNHDASFFSNYGGEHTVDVHRIFKNFDADENDPSSYVFEPTDEYIKTTLDAGTKIFYRLGASIEHGYKYGTKVPKDFSKWARICEHIIRHYNEGWANGFKYDIKYWEIWNEPDCYNHDGSRPCWQGTDEQFTELYIVAAKHLKKCFPHLYIGGPAFASIWSESFVDMFLKTAAKENAPLDFFSYHWYGNNIEDLRQTIAAAREKLDGCGFKNTAAILNEWNYVKGWVADDWKYSLKKERELKGASFIAAAMCTGQAMPLDMLMYYDARPCGMNGIFKYETYECLKGYYTFMMFKELRSLKKYVLTKGQCEDIYSCAATDGKNSAVMLTYYNDDDTLLPKKVKVEILSKTKKNKVQVYILDEKRNLELEREMYFDTDKFSIYLDMPLFSSALIKVAEN